MAINHRFLPAIPAGMCVLEADMEIVGVQHNKADALAFAGAKNQQIELEEEPGNELDPNAIKVFGIWPGWTSKDRRFIGYVPADSAAYLVGQGLSGKVSPRLKTISVSDDEHVVVRIDLLCPKPAAKEKVANDTAH